MPNYQNGKVYAIRTYKSDDFYIGSTTIPLSKRLCQHKQDFKKWQNGKKNYVSSYKIIENNDAYIELLELCPCDNKMLLEKREGELIRANNCVNKIIPGRTKKEYHKENKDKKNEYCKEYYEKNKDKIKEYREKNKETISKREKEYYKINKDTISEKRKQIIECDCGVVLRKDTLLKHKKTKKHKQFEEVYNFIYS